MLDSDALVQQNETYKSWSNKSLWVIVALMDVRKRIGWNLKRLRSAHNLTQEAFATDSGFDRGYVSGIERGVRNPSVLVLVRIADALNVDVVDLFDEDAARAFSKE